MPDHDLFEPQVQDIKDADQLLGMIKNDQGEQKYQDTTQALNALINAQEHIRKVEADNAALREATSKAATMDEVLNALSAKAPAAVAPEPQVPHAEEVQAPAAAVDPAELENLVKQMLTQQTAEQQMASTRDQLVSRIQTQYGEAASTKLYGTFAALGYSQEETNNLLATKPKMVETLLELDKAPPRGTQAPSTNASHFQHKPETPAPSPFKAVTTAELVDSWRHTANAVNKEHGIS